MTEAEILALLRDRGAILEGHFLLTSGMHSDTYVEKARVMEDPAAVVTLGEEIASWHERIQAVVSPAVGAIPLGFATALAAGARFLYAEREDGVMTLRRGFELAPGERTLVVEDVVTTGGSAAEVFDLVRASRAEPLGVAALVDRSFATLAYPLRALVRVAAEAFDPSACPMCARDEPMTSRGSRHV